MAYIEGQFLLGTDPRHYGSALEEPQLLLDAPCRVYDGGNAAVSGAHQKAAGFDGSQSRHLKMLGCRCAFSVPRIIGNVDQQLCSFGNESANQLGKNRFKADEAPDPN